MLPRICFGVTLLIAITTLLSSCFSETSALNLGQDNNNYQPHNNTRLSGSYVGGVWIYAPFRAAYSDFNSVNRSEAYRSFSGGSRSTSRDFRGGGPGSGK